MQALAEKQFSTLLSDIKKIFGPTVSFFCKLMQKKKFKQRKPRIKSMQYLVLPLHIVF